LHAARNRASPGGLIVGLVAAGRLSIITDALGELLA